jgi:dihydroorotate dehydrogenase
MRVSYTTRIKVLSTILKLWAVGKTGRDKTIPGHEAHLMGLPLRNPIGLAAGFDLSGRLIAGARNAGFGFTEVGTVTPDNLSSTQRNLKWHSQQLPGFAVGVNVGCRRGAIGQEAINQTVETLGGCLPLFDFATINLSSPFTRLAREDGIEWIKNLLSANAGKRDQYQTDNAKRVPLALKVSAIEYPAEKLHEILLLAIKFGYDGVVLVSSLENAMTTINETMKTIKAQNSDMAIISVGGVITQDDVQAHLEAGVSAVQVFTSVMNNGVFLPRRLLAQG